MQAPAAYLASGEDTLIRRDRRSGDKTTSTRERREGQDAMLAQQPPFSHTASACRPSPAALNLPQACLSSANSPWNPRVSLSADRFFPPTTKPRHVCIKLASIGATWCMAWRGARRIAAESSVAESVGGS